MMRITLSVIQVNGSSGKLTEKIYQEDIQRRYTKKISREDIPRRYSKIKKVEAKHVSVHFQVFADSPCPKNSSVHYLILSHD